MGTDIHAIPAPLWRLWSWRREVSNKVGDKRLSIRWWITRERLFRLHAWRLLKIRPEWLVENRRTNWLKSVITRWDTIRLCSENSESVWSNICDWHVWHKRLLRDTGKLVEFVCESDRGWVAGWGCAVAICASTREQRWTLFDDRR